jgi:hypothetical protein
MRYLGEDACNNSVINYCDLCTMNALQTYFQQGTPGSLTYGEYVQLIDTLLAAGKTTGTNHSEFYLNYTQLNVRRMNRVAKTFNVREDLRQRLAQTVPQTWLVLTEAWCGDAAQSLPLMNALAGANPNIKMRLILRDEHPEIMNLYLTDGGKGIPVLISLDGEGQELFHWGPRPAPAQQMVRDYKAAPEPKDDYMKFAEQVQLWYLEDKGQTFQNEFDALISTVNTAKLV